VRLAADVGNCVRSDCAIESGKYRLNKRIMQHLHERLPGGDFGPREFALQVDLGCDLLRAAILEKMRGATNH